MPVCVWVLAVCQALLHLFKDFNVINSFNPYTNSRRWALLPFCGLQRPAWASSGPCISSLSLPHADLAVLRTNQEHPTLELLPGCSLCLDTLPPDIHPSPYPSTGLYSVRPSLATLAKRATPTPSISFLQYFTFFFFFLDIFIPPTVAALLRVGASSDFSSSPVSRMACAFKIRNLVPGEVK